MAWIDKRRRGDRGISVRVVWRLGGVRDGAYQVETFGAGTDAQNLAQADGFKKMVDAAGQRWPDGWVRGEGFVRPQAVEDPLTPPPAFDAIGEEYVRQIVNLSPGQQKRYLGQLKVLAGTRVRGSLVFTRQVTSIHESDSKDWLIDWDRSLKTKANYPGLIHGVFAYAVKRGGGGRRGHPGAMTVSDHRRLLGQVRRERRHGVLRVTLLDHRESGVHSDDGQDHDREPQTLGGGCEQGCDPQQQGKWVGHLPGVDVVRTPSAFGPPSASNSVARTVLSPNFVTPRPLSTSPTGPRISPSSWPALIEPPTGGRPAVSGRGDLRGPRGRVPHGPDQSPEGAVSGRGR